MRFKAAESAVKFRRDVCGNDGTVFFISRFQNGAADVQFVKIPSFGKRNFERNDAIVFEDVFLDQFDDFFD